MKLAGNRKRGILKQMKLLINLIVGAIAVFVAAYVIPGVIVSSFVVALVVAVVLGAVNAILRPVLLFLTLPITLLTFGLFALVINAALVLLVAQFVPGFTVTGFVPALLFSLALSLVSSFLNKLAR